MPLADDVTTGAKGPRKSLLDELKNRATSSGADYSGAPTSSASSPSTTTPLPSKGSPGFDLIAATSSSTMDELGMRAGALTTVPEVEAFDSRLSVSDDDKTTAFSELAKEAQEKGIRGTGVRAYIQQRTGTPGSESFMQEELRRETPEEIAGRERRVDRAAMNLGGRRQRTEALTADEYAAFTPKQKAAIDLNTMLVQAVTNDLQAGKADDVKPADSYAGDYEEVFGAAPKDRPYAPETVKLLGSIGADLDGFNINQVLKMKGGFTRDDLERLGDKPLPGTAPDASLRTPQVVRGELQDALASTLMDTRKDPARGAGLLQVQQNLTGTDTMPGAGPTDQVVQNADGTLTGPEDQMRNYWFQRALAGLTNPEMKGQREQILTDMRAMTGEEEWPLFLNFVGARLRESKQYDWDLDENPNTEQLKPGGVMKRLGL